MRKDHILKRNQKSNPGYLDEKLAFKLRNEQNVINKIRKY